MVVAILSSTFPLVEVDDGRILVLLRNLSPVATKGKTVSGALIPRLSPSSL